MPLYRPSTLENASPRIFHPKCHAKRCDRLNTQWHTHFLVMSSIMPHLQICPIHNASLPEKKRSIHNASLAYFFHPYCLTCCIVTGSVSWLLETSILNASPEWFFLCTFLTIFLAMLIWAVSSSIPHLIYIPFIIRSKNLISIQIASPHGIDGENPPNTPILGRWQCLPTRAISTKE
jgi:hypothetical protein